MNTILSNPIDSENNREPDGIRLSPTPSRGASGELLPGKRRVRGLTARKIVATAIADVAADDPGTGLVDRMAAYRDWWNVPKAKPSRHAAHRP